MVLGVIGLGLVVPAWGLMGSQSNGGWVVTGVLPKASSLVWLGAGTSPGAGSQHACTCSLHVAWASSQHGDWVLRSCFAFNNLSSEVT